MLLAGCGSSSKPAAAPHTTSTTAKGVLAAQPRFAEPTFIESFQNGRIAVARLADGKMVQVLAPVSGTNARRSAMRAPNGDLLLEGCAPSCGDKAPDYTYAPYWQNTTTGVKYAGDPARVSPDGTRIAAVVTDASRKQTIRLYDVATGHVLSDLVVGAAEGFGSVTGFDWTPDSDSLIVTVAPDAANPGGVYVVERGASNCLRRRRSRTVLRRIRRQRHSCSRVSRCSRTATLSRSSSRCTRLSDLRAVRRDIGHRRSFVRTRLRRRRDRGARKSGTPHRPERESSLVVRRPHRSACHNRSGGDECRLVTVCSGCAHAVAAPCGK